MAERWVKQVAGKPGFLFTAKLWQRFTHERERAWTAPEVEQFKSGIRPLREANRFGALLMQFPWSFTATEPSRDSAQPAVGGVRRIPLRARGAPRLVGFAGEPRVPPSRRPEFLQH